jgi:hypothetical protein
MFHVTFTLDGVDHLIVMLVVDEPGDAVTLGVAVCQPLSMFPNPASKMACDANVDRSPPDD